MANYVLTAANRFYAVLESAFGTVPAIAASNAFKAIKLSLDLQQKTLERKDKDGGRSFLGSIPGGKRNGNWNLSTHLIPNGTNGNKPDIDPLFQSLFGQAAKVVTPGSITVAAGSTTTSITTSGPHSLVVGDYVVINNELRYITDVGSSTTFTLDPPLSATPATGAEIKGSIVYKLNNSVTPPSVTLFSYYDPVTAQQLIAPGCVVDKFSWDINGDIHDLTLSGQSVTVLDSFSFSANEPGAGGLASFPAEPSNPVTNGVPIAGDIGEVWIGGGGTTSQYVSLTKGKIDFTNDIQLRMDEFGSQVPRGAQAGVRSVLWDFDLYETDDAQAQALYAAAKSRTPVPVFYQAGNAAGALVAAYSPAVVPQLPTYDEGDRNLKWSFSSSRAQRNTASNDEFSLAFG